MRLVRTFRLDISCVGAACKNAVSMKSSVCGVWPLPSGVHHTICQGHLNQPYHRTHISKPIVIQIQLSYAPFCKSHTEEIMMIIATIVLTLYVNAVHIIIVAINNSGHTLICLLCGVHQMHANNNALNSIPFYM